MTATFWKVSATFLSGRGQLFGRLRQLFGRRFDNRNPGDRSRLPCPTLSPNLSERLTPARTAASMIKPGEMIDVIEMSPLTLTDRRDLQHAHRERLGADRSAGHPFDRTSRDPGHPGRQRPGRRKHRAAHGLNRPPGNRGQRQALHPARPAPWRNRRGQDRAKAFSTTASLPGFAPSSARAASLPGSEKTSSLPSQANTPSPSTSSARSG